MSTIIAAIVTMAVIGVLLGVVIGVAARVFKVEIDPRIEQVTELLPGANCGGCGKAGCADFAKAVVEGEATPDKCPVCSADATAAIASLLGIDAGDSVKKVAVVLCGGDRNQIHNPFLYNGINDCVSASLVAGGPKGCTYGCLGLASCARACPFNAIEMINGLAVVHEELCVGCGKCVDTCPRGLVHLIPTDSKVHVYCSSPEKGPVKKKVCKVACIGCRKCVKASEEGQITMDGFRAVVNYDNPPDASVVEKAQCPTNAILTPDQHVKIEIAEKGA